MLMPMVLQKKNLIYEIAAQHFSLLQATKIDIDVNRAGMLCKELLDNFHFSLFEIFFF